VGHRYLTLRLFLAHRFRQSTRMLSANEDAKDGDTLLHRAQMELMRVSVMQVGEGELGVTL
jgi:hypothetical protein